MSASVFVSSCLSACNVELYARVIPTHYIHSFCVPYRTTITLMSKEKVCRVVHV